MCSLVQRPLYIKHTLHITLTNRSPPQAFLSVLLMNSSLSSSRMVNSMPSLSLTSWYLPEGVMNFHSSTSPCRYKKVRVPSMLQLSNSASMVLLPAPELYTIFLPSSPFLLKYMFTTPNLLSFFSSAVSSSSQLPMALRSRWSSMKGRRTSPSQANFLPVRSIQNSVGKQSAMGDQLLVMSGLRWAGSAVDVFGGSTAISCSNGLKGSPKSNYGGSTTYRSEKKGEQWKGQYHDQLATPLQQYRQIQLRAYRYEVLMLCLSCRNYDDFMWNFSRQYFSLQLQRSWLKTEQFSRLFSALVIFLRSSLKLARGSEQSMKVPSVFMSGSDLLLLSCSLFLACDSLLIISPTMSFSQNVIYSTNIFKLLQLSSPDLVMQSGIMLRQQSYTFCSMSIPPSRMVRQGTWGKKSLPTKKQRKTKSSMMRYRSQGKAILDRMNCRCKYYLTSFKLMNWKLTCMFPALMRSATFAQSSMDSAARQSMKQWPRLLQVEQNLSLAVMTISRMMKNLGQ